MRTLAAAAILALPALLAAQQPVDVNQMVTTITKEITGWNQGINTPGLTMRLEEKAHPDAPPGAKAITYAVYISGLPAGERLSLYTLPITRRSPVDSLDGITLSPDGLAICAGQPDTCGTAEKPNDPMDLVVMGAPGEPMRFMLATADGKYRVADMIVANPLVGSDHGCQLEALRGLPRAELVILRGSGFAPHAKIRLENDSEGEHHDGNEVADAAGKFISALLPAVKGKAAGTLTAHAIADACKPQVSIQWGAGSYYGK